MTVHATQPVVVAFGWLDREHLLGSSGCHQRWSELDAPAPGTGRTFRAAFGRADETFRRLDALSRAVVLAAEAAGLATALPAELRAETAVLFETQLGCLDADLRFARSMAAGLPEGPIFPYTLPSTSLGELALRHGLRGPSNCLCVLPGERSVALREAQLLFASGEARLAVVARAEVLTVARPSVEVCCEVAVALLALPEVGLREVAGWQGAAAGLAGWLAGLRGS